MQTGVAFLIFTQAILYVLVAELVLHCASTAPVPARIPGCWQGLTGLFNRHWGCCLPHAIYSCSGSQSLNHLSYLQCLCCGFVWNIMAVQQLPMLHVQVEYWS